MRRLPPILLLLPPRGSREEFLHLNVGNSAFEGAGIFIIESILILEFLIVILAIDNVTAVVVDVNFVVVVAVIVIVFVFVFVFVGAVVVAVGRLDVVNWTLFQVNWTLFQVNFQRACKVIKSVSFLHSGQQRIEFLIV